MVLASINVMAMQALQTPAEDQQVFLQTDQQFPINPSVVAAIDDGLTVAGYSGTRAWAAKTDLYGKILWAHHIEKPAGYERHPWLQVRPEFRCAAGMSDGSVWLAGSTIDSYVQAGLLVHLDRAGNVLESRTARPSSPSANEARTSLLVDCVRFGAGVAIAGTTAVRTPEAARDKRLSTGHGQKLAYWVLIVDADGWTKYEAVIPTGQDTSVVPKGLNLLAIESSLFVSATTNVMTEVLGLSPTCVIEARRQFPDAYMILVRPVVPDGRIQLFGALSATAEAARPQASNSILLSLDDKLRDLQRQGTQERLSGSVVYRMADQSLMIFGGEVHDVGERFTSAVTYVDSMMQHKRTLNPPRHSFYDTGTIYTAAPLGADGRFVAAATAVVKGWPDHAIRIDGLPDFSRGAALDFIVLKSR